MTGRPIVLDVGSQNTRVGFSGMSSPSSIFSTTVGRPRAPGMKGLLLGHASDVFIGDQVDPIEGLLSLSNPVSRGRVVSFELLELLLHHAFFSAARAPPDAHGILLTHAPAISDDERERYLELMFESFATPSFAFLSAAPTTLYASGRSSGVALLSGAGVSHAVAVYGGVELMHQHTYSEFGGDDVSNLLSQVLHERGYPLHTSIPADRAIIETVKAALCAVPPTPLQSVAPDAAHVLPDGSVISLGADADRVAAPSVTTLSSLVSECLLGLPIDIRRDVAPHIVIDGGNTLLQGLPIRLEGDIAAQVAAGAPADVPGVTWPRLGLGAGGCARSEVLTRAALAQPERKSSVLGGPSARTSREGSVVEGVPGGATAADASEDNEAARPATKTSKTNGSRTGTSAGRAQGRAQSAAESAATRPGSRAATAPIEDAGAAEEDPSGRRASTEIAPPHADATAAASVAVHASPARQHLAWAGGSILASLSTFTDLAFRKSAYDEGGMSILYSK